MPSGNSHSSPAFSFSPSPTLSLSSFSWNQPSQVSEPLDPPHSTARLQDPRLSAALSPLPPLWISDSLSVTWVGLFLHPRSPSVLAKPEPPVTLQMGEITHLRELGSKSNGTCEDPRFGTHQRPSTPSTGGASTDPSWVRGGGGRPPEPGPQHCHIQVVCPEFSLFPWAPVSHRSSLAD